MLVDLMVILSLLLPTGPTRLMLMEGLGVRARMAGRIWPLLPR